MNLGVEVLIVKADISKPNEVENLINDAKNKFGKIDIMVNNAGITKDTLIIKNERRRF